MNDPHLLHHQITNQITESPILSPYLNQPDNIYPGKASANPNQINSLSSELFIEKFSEINHYIKQHNLEKYLNDEKHLYIKPKTHLSTALTNAEEKATRAFFANLQNSKKNEILEETNKNLQTYIIAIYATAGCIIPRVVISTYCTSSHKRADADNHNASLTQLHNLWVENYRNSLSPVNQILFNDFLVKIMEDPINNPPSPSDQFDRSPQSPAPINWSQPEFHKYLTNKFNQQYETYSGDSEKLPLEGINTKLKIMGKTIEKETYVTSEKQKLELHDKTYQPIINHLHQFFTQVISTNSPKIHSLVEQHEFTKAWHQLLVEELVTRDTTQSIITLNHNILQLTYDTTKDSDFNQFYDRFTRTHALYLFKLWHQHLSFETIRYILSDLTDDGFISYLQKHHPTLTMILTRLPDQVNYNARAIQLQRAITGSHLQSSLTTYLQTNLNELDLLSLVQNLRQADPNIIKKKSSTVVSQASTRCASCECLKHDGNITSLKSHSSSDNCPAQNIAILKHYLQPTKKPTKSSKPGPSSIITQQSSVKSKVDYNTLLPPDFDPVNNCSSCYLSGISQPPGTYSSVRKAYHTTHSSDSCLWVKLRQKGNKGVDIIDQYKEKYSSHSINPSTHHQSRTHHPSRSEDTYRQPRAHHTSHQQKRYRSPSEYHDRSSRKEKRLDLANSQLRHSRDNTNSPQTVLTSQSYESNHMHLSPNRHDDDRSQASSRRDRRRHHSRSRSPST